MSKVICVGNAVVLVSSMKFEDILKIKKYRPDALTVKDEDGNQVYAITATCGNGAIGKYGAEFGGKPHDEDGFATITMLTDADGDIKEYLVDTLGAAIKHINDIESKAADVIAEIDADRAAIAEAIEIR